MKSMIRMWSAAAAVVSLAGITGCASQSGDSYTPPAATGSVAPSADEMTQAAATAITIRAFRFEVPASVRPGSMVTVTNGDGAPHTLKAKGEGGFDLEVPAGGNSDVPGSGYGR